MSDLNVEEIADGLALWEEHKPRTIDDWKEIARLFSEQLSEAALEILRLKQALSMIAAGNITSGEDYVKAVRQFAEGELHPRQVTDIRHGS